VEKLIRIGVDTSKSVFQLHGVNAREEVVLRKKLRRAQLLTWSTKLERTASWSSRVRDKRCAELKTSRHLETHIPFRYSTRSCFCVALRPRLNWAL
jgi:hypothetical protein